jgi:NitT/TauT family transport system substrate-binding protein
VRTGWPCAGGGLRRWLHALGAGAAGLLLLACSPAPHPPLTVGMNAWVGYDPLVLARDQKLIDAQQVKVVELSSSSETLRHFRNGLLDAAALTLDETLRLADEGIALRVVAVMDASHGADVVLADPRIHKLADLHGASIAVESTTVGALMLQRLLQAAGLQPTEVDVVNLEATQHLSALRTQRVSAAVSYEPVAGALRAAGFKDIFDSRQMPGDIVDVLVVRADLLQTRPAQVEALLAAWQDGLQALRDDPGAAARLLAPGTDLTPDDYLATLQRLNLYAPASSLALLSGTPPPLARDAQRLVATLQQMGLLANTPDWGQLIAPEPALRLQAKGRPR